MADSRVSSGQDQHRHQGGGGDGPASERPCVHDPAQSVLSCLVLSCPVLSCLSVFSAPSRLFNQQVPQSISSLNNRLRQSNRRLDYGAPTAAGRLSKCLWRGARKKSLACLMLVLLSVKLDCPPSPRNLYLPRPQTPQSQHSIHNIIHNRCVGDRIRPVSMLRG